MSDSKRFCRWIFDGNHGKHDTTCGNAFTFTDDGVKENGFKCCPYCGKGITNYPGKDKAKETP